MQMIMELIKYNKKMYLAYLQLYGRVLPNSTPCGGIKLPVKLNNLIKQCSSQSKNYTPRLETIYCNDLYI